MTLRFQTPEDQARHMIGVRAEIERIFNSKQSRHLNPAKALEIYIEMLAPRYRLDDITAAVDRILLRQGPFPEIADITAMLDVVIENRLSAERRRELLREITPRPVPPENVKVSAFGRVVKRGDAA